MASEPFSPHGDFVVIFHHTVQILGDDPAPLGYKHDGRCGNVFPIKCAFIGTHLILGSQLLRHVMTGLMHNAIGSLSGVAFNIGVGTFSSQDNWATSSRHVSFRVETFLQMMIGLPFSIIKFRYWANGSFSDVVGYDLNATLERYAKIPPHQVTNMIGWPGHVWRPKMGLCRVTFNIGVGTFRHMMIGLFPNVNGRLSGVAFSIGIDAFPSRDIGLPFWRRV